MEDAEKVMRYMKAAGLTHGAFYAHFGSKEELKAAAVAYGLKVWLRRVQRSNSENILFAKRGDRKEVIFQVAAMIGGVVLARAVQDHRLSDEIH
jgi:TetR/AcrR family transcriptional regulator, transcriptional repressor for nem operon